MWGTAQQQLNDDLSRLVRRFDRDLNGNWSFREFLTFCGPLSQYSLKAKGLSKALEISIAGGADGENKLMMETSSSASLAELNAMLKRKTSGKENLKANTVPAFSRATKSTAAMSIGDKAGNMGQYSTLNAAGMHSSAAHSVDQDIDYLRADSALTGNVMNYPYMCD